jgi:hypothetical protein
MTITKPQAARIEAIAMKHFDVATLETRKSDSLDFHEIAVWEMKAALEAAFAAGRIAQ